MSKNVHSAFTSESFGRAQEIEALWINRDL